MWCIFLLHMFERFKHAFRQRPASSPSDSPVSRWATSQFLHLRPGDAGQFSIDGQLLDRPFRAECGPSSRPYIEGMELRVKVDLQLPPFGQVVVMSRAVRDALARMDIAAVQTAGQLVDEKRWLAELKGAQWDGPPEAFWARYAVISDAPELARRWLNADAVEFLTLGSSEAAARVPLLIALMRGKCYLRLQVNPHARDADTLLALELLEHLIGRALELAGRGSASRT
jgi:hypothetical protein